MKFTTAGHENINSPSLNVHMNKITAENIDTLKAIDSNIDARKPLLEQKNGPCEAFALWSDSGEALAYVWLMYKGGNYGWWHFRNIDAWIFGVFVREQYRRKGLCEYMMHNVLNYLNAEKNIDEAYLTVRIRNYPARNAYKKLGGTEIAHKKTFRICRVQIPFHGYTL